MLLSWKKEEHLERVQHFLRAFENRITFVAPAEYTKEHWIAFYPEYADKTIVISHQKQLVNTQVIKKPY